MTKSRSSPPSDSRLGGLTIQLEYPFYEDLLEGGEAGGALTLDRSSHACWHYVKLAHRSLAVYAGGIDNQQIQYRVGETPPEWAETRFEEIARSVAILYALDSPSEFLHDHWKSRVWQTAKMLGMQIDSRVWQVAPGRLRLQ